VAGDTYAAAAAGRAKTVCVVARHAPRLEAIVAMRDQDTIN
jgi:short-subunit dehydrogenase